MFVILKNKACIILFYILPSTMVYCIPVPPCLLIQPTPYPDGTFSGAYKLMGDVSSGNREVSKWTSINISAVLVSPLDDFPSTKNCVTYKIYKMINFNNL